MEKIRKIVWTKRFENSFKKIRHRSLQDRVEKHITKIQFNPESGKPLRYNLRGERATYVKPFRILYMVDGYRLILLKFEHRKGAYKR